MSEDLILEVEGKVNSVERTEVDGVKKVEIFTQDSTKISIEVPSNLLQVNEGDRMRVIMSWNASIEKSVDGLFLCTIYDIERRREGKKERTLIYGSIGGLQVRVEGRGLHKKVELGSKIYLGIKFM